MKIKKYFLLLVFIVTTVSMLASCNLRVASPEEMLQFTLTSQMSGIPSSTTTPLPLPTAMLTFTSTTTPMPTPTVTLFFAPTATPTRQWSSCPGIVVTQADTDAGDMLHVLRCEDGFKDDLGPLEKGIFAVGPNDKFLIYVTFGGLVYGVRIGDSSLFALFNLKREKIFTVFNIGTEPDMIISFSDGSPNYKLVLIERSYDQKRMYELPTHLTH